VMETAYSGFELLNTMVESGNPGSVSDAAVGALALLACIRGAGLNVRINAAAIDDMHFVEELLNKAQVLESEAVEQEKAAISNAEAKIRRQPGN